MQKIGRTLISIVLVFVLCAGVCGSSKEPHYTVERSDATSDLGENIVAEMFIPDADIRTGKTLIMCHGLTGCRENFREYAQMLADNGVVVCIFDFRGGGNECESDGSTLLMTAWTEYDDLVDIYDMVAGKDYVDPDNIYILGHSQGGLVASLFAADYPDAVEGLILMAPAYNIPDEIRANFPTVTDILPVFPVEDMILGYFYAYDIYDMDALEEIEGYDGRVLILHGADDTVVPLSYSESAMEIYEPAKLVVIEGCNHRFDGDDIKAAAYNEIVQFMRCRVRARYG